MKTRITQWTLAITQINTENRIAHLARGKRSCFLNQKVSNGLIDVIRFVQIFKSKFCVKHTFHDRKMQTAFFNVAWCVWQRSQWDSKSKASDHVLFQTNTHTNRRNTNKINIRNQSEHIKSFILLSLSLLFILFLIIVEVVSRVHIVWEHRRMERETVPQTVC